MAGGKELQEVVVVEGHDKLWPRDSPVMQFHFFLNYCPLSSTTSLWQVL